MSSGLVQAIVGIVGALGVVLGALATFRQARDARASNLIDDYAEELDRERKQRRGDIARIESRLDASLRRERIRDDYIAALRQHIADGRPPPPPPWPEGLRLPCPPT